MMQTFNIEELEQFSILISKYYKGRTKSDLDNLLLFYLDKGAAAFDLEMLKETLEEMDFNSFIELFQEWIKYSKRINLNEDKSM